MLLGRKIAISAFRPQRGVGEAVLGLSVLSVLGVAATTMPSSKRRSRPRRVHHSPDAPSLDASQSPPRDESLWNSFQMPAAAAAMASDRPRHASNAPK